MLCMPMLLLWDTVIRVMGKVPDTTPETRTLKHPYPWSMNVDWVPPQMPPSLGLAKIVVCEDNDAVLKMVKKGRMPKLLHVARTHRVNLHTVQDALRDPAYRPRYINTKAQIADMFTKGSHTSALWNDLLARAQIEDATVFTTLKNQSIKESLKAAADASNPEMLEKHGISTEMVCVKPRRSQSCSALRRK